MAAPFTYNLYYNEDNDFSDDSEVPLPPEKLAEANLGANLLGHPHPLPPENGRVRGATLHGHRHLIRRAFYSRPGTQWWLGGEDAAVGEVQYYPGYLTFYPAYAVCTLLPRGTGVFHPTWRTLAFMDGTRVWLESESEKPTRQIYLTEEVIYLVERYAASCANLLADIARSGQIQNSFLNIGQREHFGDAGTVYPANVTTPTSSLAGTVDSAIVTTPTSSLVGTVDSAIVTTPTSSLAGTVDSAIVTKPTSSLEPDDHYSRSTLVGSTSETTSVHSSLIDQGTRSPSKSQGKDLASMIDMPSSSEINLLSTSDGQDQAPSTTLPSTPNDETYPELSSTSPRLTSGGSGQLVSSIIGIVHSLTESLQGSSEGSNQNLKSEEQTAMTNAEALVEIPVEHEEKKEELKKVPTQRKQEESLAYGDRGNKRSHLHMGTLIGSIRKKKRSMQSKWLNSRETLAMRTCGQPYQFLLLA
jgi:hypothetical protein